MEHVEEFNKPLDQWVEEEVEIQVYTPVLDKRGNLKGVEQGTEKRTQKTMFSRASIGKLSCAEGEHVWKSYDKHKYDVGCIHCTKHRFLNPLKETLRDGHIISRETGEILE